MKYPVTTGLLSFQERAHLFLTRLYEGVTIIPISQVGKLRLRAVKRNLCHS